jgi:hypothetical protein
MSLFKAELRFRIKSKGASINEKRTEKKEHLSASEVITNWRGHMKRAGGSTGTQKAAQLISQAKQSIGDKTALHEAKQDLGGY